MISKDLIGKKFRKFSFTVERGKIHEFCKAIGDDNPIFFDKEAAVKEGHPDTPVPLTFQTVFVFWGYPSLWKEMENMGIDTGKILHLKEEYTYHKLIYPGTTVFGQIEIVDVKTGKLNMATFRTVYTDENDNELLTSRMTIVELK